MRFRFDDLGRNDVKRRKRFRRRALLVAINCKCQRLVAKSASFCISCLDLVRRLRRDDLPKIGEICENAPLGHGHSLEATSRSNSIHVDRCSSNELCVGDGIIFEPFGLSFREGIVPSLNGLNEHGASRLKTGFVRG